MRAEHTTRGGSHEAVELVGSLHEATTQARRYDRLGWTVNSILPKEEGNDN